MMPLAGRPGAWHLLTAAVLVCASSPRLAEAETTYYQFKGFSLTPKGKPAAITVFTSDYEHAYIHDPKFDSDTKPPGQPNGYDPGGTDTASQKTGEITNSGRDKPVLVNTNDNTIPEPGTGKNPIDNTAHVQGTYTSATGETIIHVNPYGNTTVTGDVIVKGEARATPPPKGKTDAYGFSAGVVKVQGLSDQLGESGTLALLGQPELKVASGQKFSGHNATFDPVIYTVTDLKTGQVTQGTLFAMGASLSGNGSLLLDSQGHFSVAATDATFSISMNSDLIPTSQQGDVDLVITGGVVTTSVATGIFAGFLPAVGSSGTFTSTLPGLTNGAIQFDYDLGTFGGDPLSIGMDIGGGGTAYEQAVPEPGSLVLGLIGLALASGASLSSRRRRNVVAH